MQKRILLETYFNLIQIKRLKTKGLNKLNANLKRNIWKDTQANNKSLNKKAYKNSKLINRIQDRHPFII